MESGLKGAALKKVKPVMYIGVPVYLTPTFMASFNVLTNLSA